MTDEGSGFTVRPGEIRGTGSQLRDFGDEIDRHRTRLGRALARLRVGAGRDRTGIGSVLGRAAGAADRTIGGVTGELTRVVKKSGDNLHDTATRHEHNEADTRRSFERIHGNGASRSGRNGNRGVGWNVRNLGEKIRNHNRNPRENGTPTRDRVGRGDPIDVATGRMMLTQTDVELAGVLPLLVSRTHLSGYRLGRAFGPSWESTVDQRVELDGQRVHFAAEDGTLLTYPKPVLDVPTLPDCGPRRPLSANEDGSMAILLPDEDRVLFFAPADGDRWPITGITDSRGHRVTFTRDAEGALVEIAHSAGSRIAATTRDGLVTGLRLLGSHDGDADVDLVHYRYDERRDLTDVVNSSGLPLRFDYDTDGRIVGWVDRNGMWYRYEFDVAGRCVRARGAEGCLDYTFDYDREHLVTTATDSLGATTAYQLNEQLQVIAETGPLGQVTRWEWDHHDRLLAATDPLGRTTRYAYDEGGGITGITEPDGSRTVVEYRDGRPVAVVEPDGAVWRREYAESGELTALVDPSGARTAYGYDEHGHLATVTDALGHVVRIESDAAGLPVAVTDPLGAVTRYGYDRFGRTDTITDPLGARTRQVWTVEGLPLARTSPDGAVEQWTHDGEGNIRHSVDPLGRITHTEVAHFDVPVAETAPDGARLGYAYDTELRLVAVTNPLGQVWRYRHDAAGNVLAETDFDGRTLRYRYDAAGRLTERTNAAGQTVRLRWDAGGRLAARQVGDELTEYAYDPAGRLVRARNAHADLVLAYDESGRVVAESVNGRAVTSRYDVLGRRVHRRTPSGARSGWEYDAADRPVALRVAGQTVRFTHDAAGRETERRVGTAVLAQSWDANRRLVAQALRAADRAELPLRRYTYQPGGTLRTAEDPGAGVRHYELDQADRVATVRGDGWAERYSYDPAGNIVLAERPGRRADPGSGEREYTGMLLSRAGEFRYTYDAQGRLVARQRGADVRRYQWDGLDRLTAVSTSDGQRWAYEYDPLGRRIAKRRLDRAGVVTEEVLFTWDGDQLAEQVCDRSRALVWDWAPGVDRVVGQTERIAADQRWVDRGFHAVVTDLAGTPTELVGPSGALAWHADSTLWGETVSTVGGVDTPLRFPGHYHDPETGLHYNRHRYYDPATGRYLSYDPLGLAAGPNPLAYVSNPTGWIDPTGLTPCDLAELHKNPTGPSLRLRGPRRSAKLDRAHQIRDAGRWQTIVAGNGRVERQEERVAFDQDPQTMAESNRAMTRAIFDEIPHMRRGVHKSVRNASTSAHALEAMGRHDPMTAPYWRRQDARGKRLATDAVAVHGSTRPRPQAMLARIDQRLAGAGTKLQGAQAVLADHRGIAIVGGHRPNLTFPFLTQHMAALHGSGVRVIYSETLREDGHQAMVDDYLRTGQMHPDLTAFVNHPDHAGLPAMLAAARTNGVRVQAVAGFPALRPTGMVGAPALHARIGMLNTYASQVVQRDQTANPTDKYVLEGGERHGTTHPGPPGGVTLHGRNIPANFPGLGDILQAPVLRHGQGDTFEQLR